MVVNLSLLAEPFHPAEVEWRVGQAGKTRDGKVWAKVVAYITNRAIMDRLDEVCGPANWKNEYRRDGDAVMCGLSIKVGDEWVTKWDGAENTDIEAVKGGLSGAMKRAGVQWGIGRYLYDLEEGFATIADDSDKRANWAGAAKNKDGSEKHPAFRWHPPPLPKWAMPKVEGEACGADAEPAMAARPAAGVSTGSPAPAPSRPVDADGVVLSTKKQQNMIWAKAQAKTITADQLAVLVRDIAGVESMKAIPADRVDAVLAAIAAWTAPEPEPASLTKLPAAVEREDVRDTLIDTINALMDNPATPETVRTMFGPAWVKIKWGGSLEDIQDLYDRILKAGKREVALPA